jgi:hypothetical protein
MAATGIFISYRRSDLPFAAGRLGDALAREFGADRIFRDIDDIEPGADFTEVLHGALSASAVLLVLIGKDWLHTPGDGGRRLDEPGDWVRREIASALARDSGVVGGGPHAHRGRAAGRPEAAVPAAGGDAVGRELVSGRGTLDRHAAAGVAGAGRSCCSARA